MGGKSAQFTRLDCLKVQYCEITSHQGKCFQVDARGIKFVESFQVYYLVQVGDKPTRGAKILDLILTNMEHYAIEVKIEETLGNSDHHIIRFNITFKQDMILNKPKSSKLSERAL